MKIALRLLAAGLAIGAALVLALAAIDVGRVTRALRADDAEFAVRPAHPSWALPGILPGGVVSHALGLTDDLRYRTALRRVVHLRERQRVAIGSELSVLVAGAEGALIDESNKDRDAARRSQALNLLGALDVLDPTASRGFDPTSLDSGADHFQEAVIADPTNERAQENLEIVLRILRQQGSSNRKADANEPASPGTAGLGQAGNGY